MVASASLRLSVVAVEGDSIYWLERRPLEQGRYVLVSSTRGAPPHDVTPAGTNVRTRVHEYGGGACLVSGGVVYYSEFSDQRIYRLAPGEPPRPLTPEGKWRYADAAMHPSDRWLFCVREDHSSGGEPETTIVRIAVDGPLGASGESAGDVVVSGHDFYSTPRVSPDGARLAWLAWRHPQMPWDGTELWVADLDGDGTVTRARMMAGGPEESIFQPGWSPDGDLYFVSDWTGWWNLYRDSWIVHRGSSDVMPEPRPVNRDPRSTTHESRPTTHDPRSTIHESICPLNAEFGRPQWAFGMSTWAFAGPERLVVSFRDERGWRVATLGLTSGELRVLPIELDPGHTILATDTHAVFVGGSSHTSSAVIKLSLDSLDIEVVQVAGEDVLDAQFISVAHPFEFPTEAGANAHAYYYAPRNPDVAVAEDEQPPLIVISHGGPTDAADPSLNLEIQFWTTRGFAVVDVDYGGSSGYGRAYRQRLNGRWGEVDVADCVNAARFLVEQGRVDPARLIIRGRSAGGYTTLAALAFRPEVFAAAASYYGVSDLEALARDTHKFESRYMDRLVGPYPAAKAVYHQRSPIHHVDRIACPLILLQGAEDRVVPPDQAETMAEAVRAKGLPVELIIFEGEQHGFRRADSIVRSLEAELAFYMKVFGLT
jgi:dipeptidyl aminopeptidase/acylaminoacyl peptidase